MSESTIACGPCEYDRTHILAKKWCTICEKGLCENCEKSHRKTKSLRDHKLISVEDYRKLSGISVNMTCQNHQKKYNWYCKTHDEALCVECVSAKHKVCSSVLSINDTAKNYKRSTAFKDLEQTINETLQNLQHLIAVQDSKPKDIDKQAAKIKTRIQNARAKINTHLDKLEQTLLLDLTAKSDECRLKCSKFLKQLDMSANTLDKLKQQTLMLKQFASDLQVFLGTREVNKTVVNEINTTKAAIEGLEEYRLELNLNPTIDKLSNEINQFGSITVEKVAANLRFRDAKIDKAQIHLIKPSKSVSEINLHLKQKFSVVQSEPSSITGCITGCIILSENKILVADYWGSGKLMEYNDKGQHTRDIPVSSKPFDIKAIDFDRIAVSYGDAKYIEIINITNNTVQKKINFENSCWGISYQDDKLYVIVYTKGIVMTDMTGKTLNTIKCNDSTVYNITTTRDRLYYTDWREHTVHCCSIKTGDAMWVFKNDSLKGPRGISVDNNQNLFVVGFWSNNLTVIQHDGKTSKTLLTETDGLDRPVAVYYRKDNNTLVIGDKSESFTMYSVN